TDLSHLLATVQLQEELSCSICFQCFKEPVSIHCGHSFCRSCITTYWNMGKKKSFSCPRCRETSQKKFLQRNQDLKNIVEIVSKLIMKGEGSYNIRKALC
uniref:RING-type domain-containing protein n=1 Tax=Varanus komodoensis TaxID=61221 RepID=A0A8D2LAQ0_VARKO